jgi:MoaA/NifB/PqqE/SkfB family radical SAM enzyme
MTFDHRTLKNALLAARMLRAINFSPRSGLGPLCLDIAITSACNHNCYFCAEHSYLKSERKKPSTIPESVMRRLFEDCLRLDVREVLLAGNGEPFTVKYLPDLIAEFGGKIRIKALTNGSAIKKITPLLLDKLFKLTISINSIERETHKLIHGYKNPNQFDMILGGLDRLLEFPRAREKVQINYVITSDNLHEFEAVLRYSREKDVFIAMRPVFVGFSELAEKGLTANDAEILGKIIEKEALSSDYSRNAQMTLSQVKDALNVYGRVDIEDSGELRPCYSGFYWGYITSDGEYSICCHCDKSFGNVFDDSLESIWKATSTQRMIYSAAQMGESNSPVCSSCRKCRDPYTYSAAFHRYFSRIPLQRSLLIKNKALKCCE